MGLLFAFSLALLCTVITFASAENPPIPAEDVTILRELKTAVEAKVKVMEGERRSTVQAVAKSIILNHVADKEVLDYYGYLTANGSTSTTYDEYLKQNNLDEKALDAFFNIYGVYTSNESAEKDSFNKWTQNEFDKILGVYHNKQVETVNFIKGKLSALNRLSDTTKRQYKESFDAINFADKEQDYERKYRLYLELLEDNNLN